MTATKTALDALFAVLETAAVASDVLAVPDRNNTVETILADMAEGGSVNLNVTDGDQIDVEELLGDGSPNYEIEHAASIQWIAADAELETRETAFDAGLEAITAAIAADRTLGGVVADVRLSPPEVTNGRFGDAGRPWKAADLPIVMLFTSSEPF